MKILKEFKEFAMKGNMIDMAVGIIIGAAFSTVVKSLVDDVFMPVIGKITGGVDFSNLYINLSGGSYATLAEAKIAGASTLRYGLFINSLITFTIVAWVLFMVIKASNKLKKETPPAEPTEKECSFCATKIKIKATRCPNCTSQLS